MARLIDGDHQGALGQLISREAQTYTRANRRCWIIFSIFAGLMVALAGAFVLGVHNSRVVLCFVAMATVIGWAELQVRALNTRDLHEDRLNDFEKELARSARFLPVHAASGGILGRLRRARACALMAWAPGLAFVGWLLALVQLSR
jgi:hypothetical protein